MFLLEVGKKALAFSATDAEGNVHHLKDYLGRPVVLFFYPEDGCPVSTEVACGFRDIVPKLESLTAAVLGVSPDSAESHAAFARKHRLPFPLLVDTLGRDGVPKLCEKYGVWRENSMFGDPDKSVVRTTYLVDEAGKVAHRWDEVRVAGHAEEVLAAVREVRRGTPVFAR